MSTDPSAWSARNSRQDGDDLRDWAAIGTIVVGSSLLFWVPLLI
jgi:hypothetical protein